MSIFEILKIYKKKKDACLTNIYVGQIIKGNIKFCKLFPNIIGLKKSYRDVLVNMFSSSAVDCEFKR